MKKVIILLGLILAQISRADSFERLPVTELKPLDGFYAAFLVKMPRYEKVVLDCQSFVNGMTFYQNNKVQHDVKMVNYGDCDTVYEFIDTSLKENREVCLELDTETSTVNLSNDDLANCQ